jgi:hypothetical protein
MKHRCFAVAKRLFCEVRIEKPEQNAFNLLRFLVPIDEAAAHE